MYNNKNKQLETFGTQQYPNVGLTININQPSLALPGSLSHRSSPSVSPTITPSHAQVAPLSAKSLFLGRNYGNPISQEIKTDETMSTHVTKSKSPPLPPPSIHETIDTTNATEDVFENNQSANRYKLDSEQQQQLLQNPSRRNSNSLKLLFHRSKQKSTNSIDSTSSGRRGSWMMNGIRTMLNFQNSKTFLSDSSLTPPPPAATAGAVYPTTSGDNSMNDFTNNTIGSNIPDSQQLNPNSDEFYLKSYFFNIFKILRTKELDLEYSEYCVQKRSLTVVLGYAVFFGGSFALAVMAPLGLAKSHPYYETIVALGSISSVFNLIDTILAFAIAYRQSKHCAESTSWLPTMIKQHSMIIQIVLFTAVTLGYCTRLIARTLGGQCVDEQSRLARVWNCNPYESVKQLPMDTAMAMMFTPIAYPAVFRESRMDVTMLSFFLVVLAFCIATYLIDSTQPLFFICMYVFLCIFIAFDSPRQSLISFIAHKKFQVASLENEKMAAQTEVEMRHVLGNVAHDFKTPLSSFMNGIDLIGHTMDDFEIMMCHHKESLKVAPNNTDCVHSSLTLHKHSQSFMKSMRMMLHDVRSTNSFMLMTINRCLDFTKVSKGMKLTPKYETFDLIETIAMPINCMKNIQNRVSVSLTDISGLICSHIITDKQWLQENILCLLSNAVKYSSDGEVTISISLQKYRNGNVPEEDEIPKAKFVSVPKGTSMQTVGRLKLKHVDSFATRDHPQALADGNHQPVISSFAFKSMLSDNSASELGTVGDKLQQADSQTRDLNKFSLRRMLSILWQTVQGFFVRPFSRNYTGSAPRRLHAKIIPLQQCDHYLIPQDEEAAGSMHARSSRSAGNPSTRGSSSRRVPPMNAFTSIPQQGKGFILIEVEDHGIGISEDAMKELFSPFKQTQRLAGGTGLGLFSLAKRVEAMHGSYGVKKRKDGQKGSLFWFSFPYRPDMLLAKSHGDGYARERMHEINGAVDAEKMLKSHSHDKVPEKVVFLQKREKSVMIPLDNSVKDFNANPNEGILIAPITSLKVKKPIPEVQQQGPVATGSNQPQQKKLDILVAEDSPTISKMVKMMLSRHGHKVTIAENGEEALKRVKERIQEKLPQFDVILMDMQMPVMDGLEATRRLRMLEEEHLNATSETIVFKVIGLSANSDEETTQQAFDAGIDSFIPKPFDLASFMTVMQGLEE